MTSDGVQELDSLISKLGIEVGAPTLPAASSAAPAPASLPPVAAEVDALLSKLGIDPAKAAGQGAAAAVAAASKSSAVSSGPGAAGRGAVSSGPGRAGVSSGPGAAGRATAAAPLGASSGPGAAQFKPAETTPDGQKLTFAGPKCDTCGQEVIGKVLSAADKHFHPQCFKCKQCSRLILETEPFMEESGNIYCQEDYLELYGTKCHGCKRPIEDACIRFLDRAYHPNHFVCAECGIGLLGKEYKDDEGDPFCLKCKAIRVRIRATKNDLCARCKKPILGEYIILNGQKIHPEHYRCESCGAEFLGGNAKEHDGKNYCSECFDKICKSICARCNKPIIGRSITALLRLWHPECLECSVCGESFATGKYYEHEKQAYCSFHYFKLFGKVCPRCQKTVEEEGIRAIGQTWHIACFTCNGCSKPLKDIVYDYESKPLCKGCFGKLPKSIRKAIEDKMEAEKKIRQEAEKKKKEEEKVKAAEAKRSAAAAPKAK